MNEFFKSFRFKVILCIAAFFLGIGLYSVSLDGEATLGSQLIGSVLSPVKKVSNAISDKVSLVIDLFIDSEVYVEENRQLREQVAELNNRLIDYEELRTEVEDLRKFVGIKEENEDMVVSRPCNVISRNANDPYGSFVIDRGKKDGIKLYDPVVTSEGLVGVIVEVARTYSTVRTIMSPDLSVGALCVESRDTGIVEGNLSLASDGKCKMIYIDKNNKIKNGDLMITSGKSGQFPRGYVIGNVTEVGIEGNGLTAYAVIKPSVDIAKINSVMVITEFDKSEEDKEIPTGNVGDKKEEPTEKSDESSDSSDESDNSGGNYGSDDNSDDNNEDSSEEQENSADEQPENNADAQQDEQESGEE